jgi:hypothetical protein
MAIGLTEWIPIERLITNEIGFGKETADACKVSARRLGELASVKPVTTMGGDVSEGLSQISLHQEFALSKGFAIAVQKDPARCRISNQVLGLACQRAGGGTTGRMTLVCDANRVIEQAFPGQGTMGSMHSVHRSNLTGNSARQRSGLAQLRISLSIASEKTRMSRGACRLATIDRANPPIGQANQDQTSAPDPRVMSIDDSEDQCCRDRGVDRISTRVQNLHRRVGR